MGDANTEIDGLIDEYRELLSIGASLRRASGQPNSEIDGLLDQLKMRLAHHTEREEAGLFQTLREVEVPPEYMGLFEHDHGHLVELIESAKRDRHGVDELLRSLEAHMVREETDMFPAAEQLLGPADWDTIEAAVAHLH